MSEEKKNSPDVSKVNLDENGEFELNDKELEDVAGGLIVGGVGGTKTVYVQCSGGLVRTGCAPGKA